MSHSEPFFSIVILHWRGTDLLQRCLQALEAQSFTGYELILLDNGSQDFPKALPVKFKQPVKLLRSEENLGFAAGNNLAAGQAEGQYLVLLNNDAYPNPDWLSVLHAAAQKHPQHFFASRLLKAEAPQVLDGEWNVYHVSGLAWRKNHNAALSQAQSEPKQVLSACAAAAAYPLEAFRAIGGFDPDYFAYMEDLDLDLRLQAAGYPCLYLPTALVKHQGSASTGARSAFQLYHGHRNLIYTFVKNMPGIFFWLLLPLHILANLIYVIASLGMHEGKALRQGKLAALLSLGPLWAKRRQVQEKRKAGAWQLMRKMDWNPLSPFVKLGFR